MSASGSREGGRKALLHRAFQCPAVRDHFEVELSRLGRFAAAIAYGVLGVLVIVVP
ncbi:hypothetical protein M2160_008353 [Streptomyces sp. SAI-117]|uniref:hypothetical protein n=1 Tax=Streptomyces sp. SAI-117 TaxID=2940546 RepID=UPI0024742466|nr:hypothetical protein [Streptomyces sp. SAI-117]MDH6573332.1 hypothetical protein [Streptomyces sp. SAI-117]